VTTNIPDYKTEFQFVQRHRRICDKSVSTYSMWITVLGWWTFDWQGDDAVKLTNWFQACSLVCLGSLVKWWTPSMRCLDLRLVKTVIMNGILPSSFISSQPSIKKVFSVMRWTAVLQVKELQESLQREKSSRTDLEMYAAVLTTQKNVLSDDVDKLRMQLNDGELHCFSSSCYCCV